jgi:NAD(P)-dependent dehydrogenase (short-subunit alcohol dehydrogenase family)
MQSTQKTIVLTGASRGLGLALARELAHLGHRVEGCSRSGRSASALDFDLEAVDVSDAAQVTRWARALLDRGCVPDILICNAAVINEPAPLWRVPPSEFCDVITTNVLGTGYTLQAFVPAMVNRGEGLIVTLSSGWGRSAAAEMAPYCASKWGVEALTLSLARELPAGMAALTLNPGIVRTDMLRKCWPGRGEEYEFPDSWARRAVEFILRLSVADNGSQMTVPGA